MDVKQIVGSLKTLETELGFSPSVKEIAEQAGCSSITARAYLQRAVGEGLIVQRDGRYMSLEVARAFERGGK